MPKPPFVAAACLGALAFAQIVLHPGRPVGDLVLDLVLALCSTLPLAFVGTRLPGVGAVVTVSVLLTLVLGRQPTLGGLLAQAVVLYLLGARVLSRSRAEKADRRAADGAYADMALAYAAREERARIARELHDIVAHHISSISVQAETTRLTTRGMPAEGATRLLAIGETARLALTEMRRLLGVLRDDAGAEPVDVPQPGVGQLITLVDEARATAGSSIRLIVHGRARALDPGIELTAYRIVQEALTNSRRHAPEAAVDVEVRYADDALRLNIWDAGSPGEAWPDGYGLLGMRERVAMAGGTLRTGRSRMGGFVVQAVLPVAGAGR